MGFPVVSSTFAAMASQMGLSSFHALCLPPGMREGPKRAPSSPPETPEPINRNPFSFSIFSRRIVSVQRALPPSIMMSSGSRSSVSPSITASVGPPAWTRMMTLRGLLMDCTNSSRVLVPTTPPGVSGFAATNSSVFEVVRL